MAHMNYLVYKKKYTAIKKNVINKISIKREKINFFYFLNSPVSLIAYVGCCLRKRRLVAFCEKSSKGTDTSSSPVCVKKRVMYLGQGIQKGS